MEFSRSAYLRGYLFPSQEDLPNPGTEPRSLALQADSLPTELSGKPKVKITQLCPTLCDPMDCSLPGSFVHEILQAGILEWVAIPFCRESSQPRQSIPGLLCCRRILYHLSHQGSMFMGQELEKMLFFIVSFYLPKRCCITRSNLGMDQFKHLLCGFYVKFEMSVFE